jgi:hypothetical protein
MEGGRMNRHERRRLAAMQRQNKFVTDYVQHLPEVGLEGAYRRGQVTHTVHYHDDRCRIYDGGACNCNPAIRYFVEPKRS